MIASSGQRVPVSRGGAVTGVAVRRPIGSEGFHGQRGGATYDAGENGEAAREIVITTLAHTSCQCVKGVLLCRVGSGVIECPPV